MKIPSPFAMGLPRRQREIMVAPISEKARFVDPLAAVVTAAPTSRSVLFISAYGNGMGWTTRKRSSWDWFTC